MVLNFPVNKGLQKLSDEFSKYNDFKNIFALEEQFGVSANELAKFL